MERWSPTLDEAFDVYLADAKSRLLKPLTIVNIRHRLSKFFAYVRADNVRTIADLRPHHLRGYIATARETGLSIFTIHGECRTIKAWLNFCATEGMIDESPFVRVALPRKPKLQKPALTVAEVKLLLSYADERDTTIILVLIDAGLRASELCALNGGDIDLISGLITVRQGKGGKDRVSFLGGKARKQIIRLWRTEGKPGENEPVFKAHRSGERLTRSGLRQLLVRLGEQAGVKNCSPHAFRRTAATWAWQNGMDLRSIQTLLGHSNISTTQIYLDVDIESIRRQHERHGPVDANL